MSRREWGATQGVSQNIVPLSQRRFFVVHWPGSGVSLDEAGVMRAIEAQHRRQGWNGIGYNFCVGQSGTIYEGRGLDIRGSHSPPRNVDGFGICVLQGIGTSLSQPARTSTRALYDELCRTTGRNLQQWWHSRDQPTQCPGPALIDWISRGMAGGIVPPPPTQDWFDTLDEATLRRIIREEIHNSNVRAIATVRGPDNVVWALSGAGRFPVHPPQTSSLNARQVCDVMRLFGLIGPGTQSAPSISSDFIAAFPRI